MNHKILLVDDERYILTSLKRLLFREPYEIVLANGGEEAIKLLETQEFSLIVSDMRMPEIDGVAVLKKAFELCPDTIRIVLSGYADKDMMAEVVNKTNLWRYIMKPWDDDELKIQIRNAVELYQETYEKKQLLIELDKKNQELSDLNLSLEKKVEERTWELKVRAEILLLIAEEADMQIAINKICESIQKVSQAESVQIIDKKQVSKDNEFAIVKGDVSLGVLEINNAKLEAEKYKNPVVKAFLPLLTLALTLQDVSKKTPTLMKNVDDLLNEF